jgi:hypothetical protein
MARQLFHNVDAQLAFTIFALHASDRRYAGETFFQHFVLP